MLRAGLLPNKFTFTFLLKACAALPELLGVGAQAHASAVKFGFGDDHYVQNTLIPMCSADPEGLGSALKVFDRSPRTSPVTWSAMIGGYVRSGCSDRAVALFREMQTSGVRPNEVTSITVLGACADLGALELVRWICSYVERGRIQKPLPLCNSVLDALKSIISWTSVTDGLAMHGRGRHRTVQKALLRPSSSNFPWIPSYIPYSDVPKTKGKVAPLQERKMVDRVRLRAKGGDGGNGCHSYRRTRTDRNGRPDGGNGGRGGDVILECSAAVWDFSNLHHHLNAKRGGHGTSKNMVGSRGLDKVAQVPVGTVIHLVHGEIVSSVESTSNKCLDPWDIPGDVQDISCKSIHGNYDEVNASSSSLDIHPSSARKKFEMPHDGGKIRIDIQDVQTCSKAANRETEDEQILETRELEEEQEFEESEEEAEEVQYAVAELTEPGQCIVVARGGEGGLGNVSLKKDAKSRKMMHQHSGSEDFDDESSMTTGTLGSESVLILELKSIADVGLVGMPNAGKSTLLGALSRAKPTVGHYAFTTLRPNIGNLNYEDFFSVKVADIPGLIKGAHANRGLGHSFLRHIERTKVLAYVVDLAAALNGNKGVPPWEQLRDLVSELEYHQEGLSKRPSLIVANKIDEEGADDVYEELKRRVPDIPIFPVCAVLQEGVPELKTGLRRLIDGNETRGLDLEKIIID